MQKISEYQALSAFNLTSRDYVLLEEMRRCTPVHTLEMMYTSYSNSHFTFSPHPKQK